MPFEQISTLQGLSDNAITKLFQDQDGFLWIGTEYGLAFMLSGVKKSGSPTLRLITSTPFALSSLLFCDMAKVAEGDKTANRVDTCSIFILCIC
jgi:hypothetical protein